MRSRRSVAAALYLNAAILLVILLLLTRRPAGPNVATAYFPAQAAGQTPPITGGSGIFVMPAQFHNDAWGCYLLDVDAQTLCTYEYEPGERELKLTSARNFHDDVMLKNFATEPPPWEVQQMVEQERQDERARDSQTSQPSSQQTPH